MKNITALLDELRAIAMEGLTYTKDHYDVDRYKKIINLTADKYSEILNIPKKRLKENFKKEGGCITPKLGVNVAVLNKKREILVLKRADDKKWCLPGGWVDVGENFIDAARREAKEEAGIEAKIRGILTVLTKGPDKYPEVPIYQVNISFVAEYDEKKSKIKTSFEHTAFKWINLDENVDWHLGHENIPKYIHDYLEKNIFIPC
ncbi:MAG: NUDIX hydrolase N-terminal domain-containing protein [Parcubacteria group bacterium]|jgi:8-oxo-dGTP pyrophosphatase MutT (NUDIX family)